MFQVDIFVGIDPSPVDSVIVTAPNTVVAKREVLADFLSDLAAHDATLSPVHYHATARRITNQKGA